MIVFPMVCLSSSGFLMRLLSSISDVWWLQRLDQLELDVLRLEAVDEQSALVEQDRGRAGSRARPTPGTMKPSSDADVEGGLAPDAPVLVDAGRW
jgi:hypothetical protein